MEKLNKDMKSLSYFVGAMGLLQVGNLLSPLSAVKDMDFTTLNGVDYTSTGVSADTILSIVKVMSVIPVVLGILAMFYLCIKGVKEANDPSPAKGHIIISVICGVCFAFTAFEGVATLLKGGVDVMMSVLEVVLAVCHTALMFYYFQFARKLRTKE